MSVVLRHTRQSLRVKIFLSQVFLNHLRYFVKELQSLALDIKILNHNMEEIDLDASFEDEDEGVVSEELVQTMEDKDGITDTLQKMILMMQVMVLDDSDENDFGVDDSDDIDFGDDDEI